MKHFLLVCVALLLLPLTSTGCDDGAVAPNGLPSTSGTVTVGVDDGIDFTSGLVQEPGNFGNSDIYSSQNGTALKLTTGGENIVTTRPITWFQTGGGTYPTYALLSQVPNVKPKDEPGLPLPKAKIGNGFVVKTAGGTYTKGIITAASATSVTIEYELLP